VVYPTLNSEKLNAEKRWSLKVDVVIPTRNKSDIRLDLLEMLQANPQVGNVIITTEKPLSVARKNACLHAETEWVAMFDDDMKIPSCWFGFVTNQVGENVGAVSTVADCLNPSLSAYQTVVNMVYPLESLDTTCYVNNVLIRRSLMETYDPPKLFLSEDFFLKRHIKQMGYMWKTLPKIGVIHTRFREPSQNISMAYRRFRHYSFYHLTRRFLARLILAPYTALITKRLETLVKLWKTNIMFFAGYLKETFNGIDEKH